MSENVVIWACGLRSKWHSAAPCGKHRNGSSVAFQKEPEEQHRRQSLLYALDCVHCRLCLIHANYCFSTNSVMKAVRRQGMLSVHKQIIEPQSHKYTGSPLYGTWRTPPQRQIVLPNLCMKVAKWINIQRTRINRKRHIKQSKNDEWNVSFRLLLSFGIRLSTLQQIYIPQTSIKYIHKSWKSLMGLQ